MHNPKFTISIPSRETGLILFIEKKRKNGNLSAYIRELIRMDMENRRDDDFEQIYQYIEKRLRERGMIIRNNEGQPKNIIDEIDKEIIMDLF